MKSPIKKPYIYDTPQGVDHITKTLEEENLTPFKKDQLDKLNRDMKLSLL